MTPPSIVLPGLIQHDCARLADSPNESCMLQRVSLWSERRVCVPVAARSLRVHVLREGRRRLC